jgi:hypoxanthine phosphoribosyltransferase
MDKMQEKIIKMSWKTMEKYAKKIFLEIKKRKFKPDVIVPIIRGGLPLSVILSRFFKIQNFEVIQIKKNNNDKINAKFGNAKIICMSSMEKIRNKNILIVEDIVASKDSLKIALKKIETYRPKSILTAALINLNKKDINIVSGKDYINNKYWIVFPWESLEVKNEKK